MIRNTFAISHSKTSVLLFFSDRKVAQVLSPPRSLLERRADFLSGKERKKSVRPSHAIESSLLSLPTNVSCHDDTSRVWRPFGGYLAVNLYVADSFRLNRLPIYNMVLILTKLTWSTKFLYFVPASKRKNTLLLFFSRSVIMPIMWPLLETWYSPHSSWILPPETETFKRAWEARKTGWMWRKRFRCNALRYFNFNSHFAIFVQLKWTESQDIKAGRHSLTFDTWVETKKILRGWIHANSYNAPTDEIRKSF